MTTRLPRRGLLALPLALALAAGVAAPAFGQGAYPNKPIRVIAPFAAGGAADTVARIVGPKLSAALGQPVELPGRSVRCNPPFLATVTTAISAGMKAICSHKKDGSAATAAAEAVHSQDEEAIPREPPRRRPPRRAPPARRRSRWTA